MFLNRRIQTATAALAIAAGATLALAPTAEAAPRHYRPLHVTGVVPAMVRAGYVGAPGYPYGPPGPVQPMLIDPGVGGGLLGIGVLPATGIFTGFPILGDLRL